MATYSSILAWKISWTEEPGGYSPWSCKELDTTERQSTHGDVSNIAWGILICCLSMIRN